MRIAMTVGDVPLPYGQTDQGAECIHFMGYQVFEAMSLYDLTSSGKQVTLIRALQPHGWKPPLPTRSKA